MRFIFCYICLLLLLAPHGVLFAQQPVAIPMPYPATQKLNYIRTWEAKMGDTSTVNLVLRPTSEVRQSTQYIDGLGRLLQTVVRQGSSLQKDLVTPVLYDSLGRTPYQYLAFAATPTQAGVAANDGSFKLDPFAEQKQFFLSLLPDELFTYGMTRYEASPFNRVQVQYSPGNSWVGAQKGIGLEYDVNSVQDSVMKWFTDTLPSYRPVPTGVYFAGQLLKNKVVDEHGRQVVEYKDKDGLLILKKVQAADSPGTAHIGWLCTYYVYDELNNLRFVIPPRAIELTPLTSMPVVSPTVMDELCFKYVYDLRNRVIIKKVPGAGETWMVYDARDRLVMTQDSNLRAQGKWMVMEYDGLNRCYRTGLLTDAQGRAYHQALAYSSSSYPSTGTGYEELTHTYYDDYSWVAGTGSGLSSAIAANYTANGNYFITALNAAPVYAVEITSYSNTRGMVTGTKTKVLSSAGQYLYAVNFYDKEGRLIQTQSTNFRTGIDTLTTQYNFSGQPLRTLLGHKKAGNTIQNHSVLTKLVYDPAARLKSISKNIDGTGDQLVDSLQYDDLGQLSNKYLGNQVDSLAYAYNIRGWLTCINKNYVTGGTASMRNYFGMDLGYDNTQDATGGTYARPAFNGNISGMLWKGGGDGMVRKYDFTYDNVSRLTGSDYTQLAGSTYDKSAGVDFSVSGLSYDANGNILSMKQRGLLINNSATIDSLSYSYAAMGMSNRLSGVTDGTNNPGSTLGDFHYSPGGKGSVDYTYDGNGNMVSDFNKGIDLISYNYLNLAQQIHFNGKGNILYTYDALGNKLAKVTMDSLSRHATTTLYMNEFVYQQHDTLTDPNGGIDTLLFAGHEEGRARWAFHRYINGTTGYRWEYDFFEKDHLGNTREVLTQQRDTARYMATMEAAYRNTENSLFYNIPQTNIWSYYVNGSSGPNPFGTAITNPNDSVSRLNGNTPKEGPAIILKVMAGDRYRIGVNAFWKSGQTSTGTTDAVTDILSSLASGIVSVAGGAKGSYGNLSNTSNSPLLAGVNAFRSDNTPTPPANPKAYLNYIALDNQLNYEPSASGAQAVGAADMLATLATDTIRIKKNGFLYIYLTNETKGISVCFDNLSVTHYSGPLLEESHYYPFGLTMAGISDKALKSNYSQNKYRYNGKELQNQEFGDGTGLEEYDYGARNYDPQIGRWQTIDELSERFNQLTPYNYVANNPLSGIDPDGKDIIFVNDPNGAMGTGHGAVIIGNAKDGYFYYSLNGAIGGPKAYGDSKDPDIRTPLEYNSNPRELIKQANTVNRNETHDFERFVIIKTTPEEDKLMMEKAAKAASVKKYILIGASCVDVQKAAYNALVENRIGFYHNYIDHNLNDQSMPNGWIKMLPDAFNDLNSYMYRWRDDDNYFQSPKLVPVIIFLPLEDVTPKDQND